MGAMEGKERLVIFTGGPGSGKTAALISRYAALPPDEKARALFVTVSRPAARELEERLRTVGAPMPPVWTLPQLPSEVLRARGIAPSRTITETDRQRLVGWLLAREAAQPDAPSRLKRWAASRRAVAQDLSAAFGLLSRCRVTPEALAAFAAGAEHGDFHAAIAALRSAYLHTLETMDATDFDGLNLHALNALRDAARVALPDILFVDEAQEMDALQARLVAALAGETGRVAAAVDSWQRTQMYRGAAPDAAAALEAAMGETAHAVPCRAEDRGDGVAAAMARTFGYPEAACGSPAIESLVARAPDDEARSIAETLRGLDGPRAVLTRSNRAAMALQEALRKEGVTVAAAWRGSNHAQRFLRNALTLLHVCRSDDDEGMAARQRSALRLLACSEAPDGEVAEARRAARERPDGPLPQRVQEWLHEAAAFGSVAQQVHWLCTCSRWIPRLPEEDRDAAARAYSAAMVSLMGLEETWQAADPNGGPMPPAEALGELRAILAAAVYPDADEARAADGEEDEGPTDLVDVLPVHQAAGRHWDHVIITELQDAGFPQYPTPSPFVPEAAAEELRAWLTEQEGGAVAMGRFERRADVTVEEERRLFLTALSRARSSVTLACHVQEGEHPVAPSWFFQKALPAGMAISPDAPSGWRCLLGDTLPVRAGGLGGCAACSVRTCDGRKDGPALAVPDLQTVEHCEAPPAAQPGRPALRPGHSFAPSAINTYFTCPRMFFLGNVMRFSDTDTDQMAAGSALHDIMKQFFQNSPPRAWEALEAAMEACFADPDAGAGFSSPAAWRLTQRKMRRALEVFWDRAASFGYPDAEPVWVEQWISFTLNDSDGEKHTFGGRADLAIPKDGGLAIVDFKSGKPKNGKALFQRFPSPTGGDTEDGVDVQLPLYALGARQEGHTPVSVTHEYICLSKSGDGTTTTLAIRPEADPPGEDPFLPVEYLDALGPFLGNMAHEIENTAAFAARPASGECKAYQSECPFVPICDRERSGL